ncbi:MAG: hypothetical protein QHJ73_01120 [Armatimonadota bacterium]|nr:hypothetical protein [Armatimonadota bacterium]
MENRAQERARTTPVVNPEYVITLQGQQYCTYRGVLDCAHAMGLEGIRTRLLQVPAPENDFVAIVEAEVRLKDGRVFTDVADASPKNVPLRLQSALVRMASTRAKGRALRDAVNIGEVLVEELPDLETEPGLTTRPQADRPVSRSLVSGDANLNDAAGAAASAASALPAKPEPEPDTLPEADDRPEARAPEQPHPHEEAPQLACSNPDCGRSVTQGQYSYSLKAYGVVLCPACQRKRASSGRAG